MDLNWHPDAVGDDLGARTDALARETAFSGVVRVDLDGETAVQRAYGLADRGHGLPMELDTRIAVASGAKTFTGLAVLRLVEDGALRLDTRARELLGPDLPLIDDAVTVEHLLSHRSGIGDYFDEDAFEDPDDYVVPVPVHTLDSAESYLSVLDGYPQAFAPGSDFAYNNGAFCVLALLAERAAATPFHDLVRRQVIERAGLTHTDYLRSDELPGDAALGYLHRDDLRTNVLHLPVIGGGDGGIYTTAGDCHRLWAALESGQVVSEATVRDAWRSRSDDGRNAYGLGFWLRGDAVEMHGADAGASFRSVHVPGRLTWSVLSNTSYGAWPVIGALTELLRPSG